MNRVRLALVALAIAAALPIGLLVSRALQSVELERRVRHEAVAARVFDEMERVLSRFLAEEEARPIEEYRYYADPGATPGSPGWLARTALSHPAAQRFVVGHFQIDPDGSLHTPLRPREPRQGVDGDETIDADAGEAIALLDRLVAPIWRDRAARPASSASGIGDVARVEEPRRSPSPEQSFARAPQRPVVVSDATTRDGEPERDAHPTDVKRKAESLYTAYDILERLNIGADSRRERKQQVREARAPEAFLEDSEFAQTADEGELREDRDAAVGRQAASLVEEEESPFAAAAEAPRLPAESVAKDARALRKLPPAPRSVEGGGGSERSLRSEPSRAPVRIVLDPMVGQPAGDTHWMLYRTVLVASLGYRQGLLLDRAELGRWLEAETLAQHRLGSLMHVTFSSPGSGPAPDPAPADGAGYRFAHRFAEPFDGVEAMLTIQPLEGTDSAGTIHALTALLAIVAVVGLVAVYRMVSVVVEFAERRNDFVAAVSHELKTPLTAIRMYGEMLRDGLIGSEAKRSEYYRTITDESERLSRLIDNVLEFSRLERGRRDLNPTVGDLGPVAQEVVDKLRPHAERAGFTLRFDAAATRPAVRFDRDAVVQMLFNLVDNAIKYGSRAERREIVVTCTRSRSGGVTLAVRDYGPGIEKGDQNRVFEPFYRGGRELTRTAKGSGIGLALVKEMAESMGASVAGSNATGGGFEVSIDFGAASSA